MARTRNRMELREQADAAEKLEKAGKKPEAKKKVAKKAATGVKKKVSKKKKVVVQRLRLMWGVFDNGNNRTSIFPFSEKAAAEQKAADMTEKGRGTYFVQPVKEPIVEEPEAPAE